jgi:hypothetical protein
MTMQGAREFLKSVGIDPNSVNLANGDEGSSPLANGDEGSSPLTPSMAFLNGWGLGQQDNGEKTKSEAWTAAVESGMSPFQIKLVTRNNRWFFSEREPVDLPH